MNFRTWIESHGNLLKAYDMLMRYYQGSSPWKNKNYHFSLVQSLQDAGLAEDAAELARLEPTDEEIRIAQSPYHQVRQGQDARTEEIFSMKRSDYTHKVEELLDKLNAQGIGVD